MKTMKKFIKSLKKWLDAPVNFGNSSGFGADDYRDIYKSVDAQLELDLSMTHVEGGRFKMGTHEGKYVYVGDFWIGTYPVKQKTWKAVMEYNPSKFIGDDLPVENVSRQEIEVFLKKLNKHKRFSQTDLLLSIGDKYRLPTEKEWEYAAGGGDMITHGFYKYSGSNNIDEVAWCKKNSNETTHPVGYKEPNQIGIYDMSGNVWELCSDIDKHKPIAKSELNLGGIYVMKGGSCVSIASECEVPYRGSYADSSKSPYIGFRLACNY